MPSADVPYNPACTTSKLSARCTRYYLYRPYVPPMHVLLRSDLILSLQSSAKYQKVCNGRLWTLSIYYYGCLPTGTWSFLLPSTSLLIFPLKYSLPPPREVLIFRETRSVSRPQGWPQIPTCCSPTLTRTLRELVYKSPLLPSSWNSIRCVSVGTRKGYSITNVDPFGKVYTMSLFTYPILHCAGDVWSIVRLQATELVALWRCCFARR